MKNRKFIVIINLCVDLLLMIMVGTFCWMIIQASVGEIVDYRAELIVPGVNVTVDMYALVEFIKNLSNYVINEDAVKYYNYAYSTKHEGRVADIIVDLIESIINCETESFNHRNGFKELYTKDNCKVYRYE